MLRSSVLAKCDTGQFVVEHSERLHERIVRQIERCQFVAAQNDICQCCVIRKVDRSQVTLILTIGNINLRQLSIGRKIDCLEVVNSDGKSLQLGQTTKVNRRKLVLVKVQLGNCRGITQVDARDTTGEFVANIFCECLEVVDAVSIHLNRAAGCASEIKGIVPSIVGTGSFLLNKFAVAPVYLYCACGIQTY